MMKLYFFFMFFSPLVFSMDENEPRDRQTERTCDARVHYSRFAELLSKTKELFDTTSDNHPFKIEVARSLWAVLYLKNDEETIYSKGWVDAFLKCYNDHIAASAFQQYASFDGHVHGVEIDFLNDIQRRALMEIIVHQVVHLIDGEEKIQTVLAGSKVYALLI